MKTVIEIIREYFPEVTDDEAWYILWNETGFPSFWCGESTEKCLRNQLLKFKNQLRKEDSMPAKKKKKPVKKVKNGK